MEYSANDIAAAKILQYLAYICVSLITFWTYDYMCSLDYEWTYLLQSRWTMVKCLYILARHTPDAELICCASVTLTPDENIEACRVFISIYSGFAVISLTCSECFFVLRTYVLWSNNKLVLYAMLSILFAVMASFVGIWFNAVATSRYCLCSRLSQLIFVYIHCALIVSTSAIPGIPGIPGCYRTSSNANLYLPFILLFVFQLGLVSLTLIRTIRNWRITRSPLYAALVKHNIFYYACGLLFSALNFIVPMIFPNVRKLADSFQYDRIIECSHSQSPYHSFLEDFEVFILAILATRMHLHLWHIDHPVHDFHAPMYISMSNLSPTA
ncbi:hypothetical protein BDR04DRAFT_331887 [Suillus decipiens]|nr:hypothetical protein BDR04DRAFT_331887 [Suillus decipiens]